jgi:hypothetical protein
MRCWQVAVLCSGVTLNEPLPLGVAIVIEIRRLVGVQADEVALPVIKGVPSFVGGEGEQLDVLGSSVASYL